MQQVVFIHGGEDFATYEKYLDFLKNFDATIEHFLPRKRWRSVMPERLGPDFQVFTPEMPNKLNAKYIEWKIWFEKMISYLEDGVILVGHSLGGIFLPTYLSENKFPRQIKAIILVSPPYDNEGVDPPLADFQLKDPLKNMSDQCEQIYIFHGDNDPVVPYSHAKKYCEQLPTAQLITIPGGEHLNMPEFPELVDLIKKIS